MCMVNSSMLTKSVSVAIFLDVTLTLACAGTVGLSSSVGTKGSVDIKEKQVDCDQKAIGLL